MGLVKALQGAPTSFKGYTDVMEKKTQRDFLSGQADLANTRAMAMKKLENENNVTNDATKQGYAQDNYKMAQGFAQDNAKTQHGYDQESASALAGSQMALEGTKQENALQRIEATSSASQEALENKKKANVEYFDKYTAEELMTDPTMTDAKLAALRYTARLDGDITKSLADWKKAEASGGLSVDDQATLLNNSHKNYQAADEGELRTKWEGLSMDQYGHTGNAEAMFINNELTSSGGRPIKIADAKQDLGDVEEFYKTKGVANLNKADLAQVMEGLTTKDQGKINKLLIKDRKAKEGGSQGGNTSLELSNLGGTASLDAGRDNTGRSPDELEADRVGRNAEAEKAGNLRRMKDEARKARSQNQ